MALKPLLEPGAHLLQASNFLFNELKLDANQLIGLFKMGDLGSGVGVLTKRFFKLPAFLLGIQELANLRQ